MLRGFKDFIMRGNVVDLAVGIVIGAAFTGLVQSFTNGFIQPLIKVFGGGSASVAGFWTIRDQKFDWSGFINAAINFIIVAAVLYFLVVMPINKLNERRRRGEEPPPKAPSEEVRLLTEIRDALVVQSGRAPASPAQGHPGHGSPAQGYPAQGYPAPGSPGQRTARPDDWR